MSVEVEKRSCDAFQFPALEYAYETIGLEHQTSFEKAPFAIPRKPLLSSSLPSRDPDSPKHGSQASFDPSIPARTLKRQYSELISTILILILPVPFYALAFYVAYMEGRDIDGPRWQSLQAYMNAVNGPKAQDTSVTAFPIIFAVVAGRVAKKFAAWRLEDQARTGDLEQLMGSTSLGGTIASIFSLRLCNALTPALLIIWSLSPIGGQSSLHLATTQPRYAFQKVNITYYDTRSESVFAQNIESVDVILPTTNAVFQTSIMEPSFIMNSTRDLWSNVKIPNLASARTLDSLLSPTWTNVTSDQDLTYSSLLGIPLSGLPENGRTTMTLEISYFTLVHDEGLGNYMLDGNQFFNTTTPDNLANGTWHWAILEDSGLGLLMALDGFNAADGNNSLFYDVYDRYSADTESTPEASRRLALASINYQYQRIFALSTTYVETSISCDGISSLCEATAIRISQLPHINSDLSNLAYSDTWTAFAGSMSSAFVTSQSGIPTITEAYLTNPGTVASTSIDFGSVIYNLTATDEQLQFRAQQLLNTYWQASVNPAVIIAGLTDANNQLATLQTRSAEGIHETTSKMCKVNWAWWMAFTCATSVMFALAIVTLTIDYRLTSPEILGYCTTFLRDSPYATKGRGVGSAIGGAERARRWKDVVIKLTDVRAGQDVGYIAVAEVGRAGGFAAERGRKRLPRDRRLYA